MSLSGNLIVFGTKVSSEHYRGRFAPSPTGPLHLGSMFTAVASYLQAKSKQGRWLLRIDDVDTPRVSSGASDSIMRTLELFALHWDEDVFMQSQGTDAYNKALSRLDEDGWIYPCSCSRKDLASSNGLETIRVVYHGTCRKVNRSRHQPHALRVITHDALVSVDDKLQGHHRWDVEREFGDFIVFRRDKIVSYHLATVIDDWRSGITEVVRGVDLLDSVPFQMYLQSLLGLPNHDYLHLPVLVDRKGIKLSKQNLAEAVSHRDPSSTLFKILLLLNQSPPADIKRTPPGEILAWATQAWDVSKLSGLDCINEAGVDSCVTASRKIVDGNSY